MKMISVITFATLFGNGSAVPNATWQENYVCAPNAEDDYKQGLNLEECFDFCYNNKLNTNGGCCEYREPSSDWRNHCWFKVSTDITSLSQHDITSLSQHEDTNKLLSTAVPALEKKFNCMTREVWSKEKQAWCDKNSDKDSMFPNSDKDIFTCMCKYPKCSANEKETCEQSMNRKDCRSHKIGSGKYKGRRMCTEGTYPKYPKEFPSGKTCLWHYDFTSATCENAYRDQCFRFGRGTTNTWSGTLTSVFYRGCCPETCPRTCADVEFKKLNGEELVEGGECEEEKGQEKFCKHSDAKISLDYVCELYGCERKAANGPGCEGTIPTQIPKTKLPDN